MIWACWAAPASGPHDRADHQDIEMMAATRANIVHCPSSNMQLASGSCPVATLQNQGITVAIGTDGAASNNSQDLFAELRLASCLRNTKLRIQPRRRRMMLKMATLDGATVLVWTEKSVL